jgi:hypothetical protein
LHYDETDGECPKTAAYVNAPQVEISGGNARKIADKYPKVHSDGVLI